MTTPTPARPGSRLSRATAATALVAAALVATSASAPASAAGPTNPIVINFASGYTAGLPNGQQSWTLPSGSKGNGNVPYDFAITDLSTHTAADLPDSGLALRISNAVVNNVYNSGLISPKLDVTAAAGETATGATLNTFTANYTIASSTGAYQEGLNVEVSIGNGGDRSGGILIYRHVNGGLQISTIWLPSEATSASSISDWRSASITGPLAGGLWDPAVAHQITTVLHFVDNGPDLFELFVDGVSEGVTPAWEYYHAIASPSTPKKTAANLMFRATVSTPSADGIGYDTTLPPATASLNQGFLFADISYGTSSIPGWSPAKPTTPVIAAENETVLPSDTKLDAETLSQPAPSGERTLQLGPDFANQYVAVYIYSTPTFLGWFLADGTGVVTFSVPASVPSGTHTIAVYDATGSLAGWVANVSVAAVTKAALAATGVEPAPLLMGAFLLAALGLALTQRRRMRSN